MSRDQNRDRDRTPSQDQSGGAATGTDSTGSSWRPGAGAPVPERPNFRLESLLGHGAFGEVWLAWHRHTQEPRVFKFCFEAEKLQALQREITLFRLLKEELGNRRDIVRILDWNFDQAPFFIEAEHSSEGDLDAWSRSQGGVQALDLELRLRLVRQIVGAVAAAHSVGVLHKDIKPENILIHDYGPACGSARGPATGPGSRHGAAEQDRLQARLTDFGIGGVLDRRRLRRVGITELGLTETETFLSTGSGLYEAPEMLEGRTPTIQADVYALGVWLYQMVVGDLRRPLAPGWERDVEDPLLRELVAECCVGNPEKRLSALTLGTRLDGLEKERHRRRLEAERRDELERQRLEVESWQRRRRLWAGGALAAALLCVMLGVSAWRIEQEVDRARQEIETADTVSQFLVELFPPSAAQGESREVAVEELLDRGVDRARLELGDRPRIQARLLNTIAEVRFRLGLVSESLALREEVLAIRRSFPASDPERLGSLVQVASAYRVVGRLEEAEGLAIEAIESFGALPGTERPVSEAVQQAAAWKVRGALADMRQDVDLTLDSYRKALDILRPAEAAERPSAEYVAALGMAWADYGWVLGRLGRSEEGLDATRRALELHEAHLPPDHPALGQVYAVAGNQFATAQRFEEAESYLERSRDIIEPRLGSDHPFIAAVLSSLGRVYMARGELAAAEQAVGRSLKIAESTLGARSLYLAAPLRAMADIEGRLGDRDGEVAMRRRLLELYRHHFDPEDSRVLQAEAALKAARTGPVGAEP